jgi:hypothetical protein
MRVVTVFVQAKLPNERLSQRRIPSAIQVRYGDVTLRLPTDVIAVGHARGRAQSVGPGTGIDVGTGSGRLSWAANGLAVTAEHVVGFDSVGASVVASGSVIGKVVRLGYQVDKVDAALVELAAGTQTSNAVGGRSVGRARYANGSDIYSPATGRRGWVYLSSSGRFEQVAIRHLHVGPYFRLVADDGTEFTPRPLALTDLCTDFGDSGTVLLGPDDRPIALLSGIVDAEDGHSYSVFTELGPALDTLQVDW